MARSSGRTKPTTPRTTTIITAGLLPPLRTFPCLPRLSTVSTVWPDRPAIACWFWSCNVGRKARVVNMRFDN